MSPFVVVASIPTASNRNREKTGNRREKGRFHSPVASCFVFRHRRRQPTSTQVGTHAVSRRCPRLGAASLWVVAMVRSLPRPTLVRKRVTIFFLFAFASSLGVRFDSRGGGNNGFHFSVYSWCPFFAAATLSLSFSLFGDYFLTELWSAF